MNKITIIGLNVIGNSIGMALRRANNGSQVVGFDPDRQREDLALRKHLSIDATAPDLQSAVQGAQLVIISTPPSAAREVLATLEPLLDDGTTVTDTLSSKEQVMAWAGELLGSRVSFVGGHPFSQTLDLETASESAAPSADLFKGAPYCIMPSPGAHNHALSQVIQLAEAIGAQPRFMDAREHDSFVAAVSHLPTIASAALLHATTTGPAWLDMSGLAHEQFRNVTEPLSADPTALRDILLSNRAALLRWIDQYLISIQEMRDLLAGDHSEELLTELQDAHEARATWAADEGSGDQAGDKLRAELKQAINDSRPSRNLMGTYLTEQLFRRKEK